MKSKWTIVNTITVVISLALGGLTLTCAAPGSVPTVSPEQVEANAAPLPHEAPQAGGAIIINHHHTNLAVIPTSWIGAAKANLRVFYAHTSHGSQPVTGMEVLMGQTPSGLYDLTTDGSVQPGALSLDDHYSDMGDLGHYGDTTWADLTRNYLNSHPNINVVVWSWCGGVSDNTVEGIHAYLNAMNQLEQEYPDVTFVYMTGHLDGTGVEGNLHQRNEQIRTYCQANGKVLFDFADIESYDPNGTTNFMALYATDGCEYDSNGDGNPWGDANWAQEWCAVHAGDARCAECDCAHSEPLNCALKGRAFWWMLARIAGWNGPAFNHFIYLPLILKGWTAPALTATPSPTAMPPGARLQPTDLVYQGAFRLPADPEGLGWEWSNWASALTYYPDGDPTGPADGYPGSLFGVGHDQFQYISEVNIPVPVVSPDKNVADLNTATTLQDFHNIRGSLFGELEMPRVGLAYLPPQGAQTTGKLYFAWASHLDEGATHPSHGWCELNLANPQSAGPWRIGDYWNYVTGDYLFDIPPAWAYNHVAGRYLATGRFRDGGQGAMGPALFAVAPWQAGNPPSAGATLPATPLLLYGNVYQTSPPALTGYHHSDEWTGGAWLTAGSKSAVVFVGTKGTGNCWYGCADGTVWEPPYPPACPDGSERGWWSTSFVGQFLFYDPADLAAVAHGAKQPWEPQPYATLNVDDRLYHLTSGQQKYHLGAVAFDQARRLLYVLEPFGDEARPLVHVWQIRP